MSNVQEQSSAVAAPPLPLPFSARRETMAFVSHLTIVAAFLWALVSLGQRDWNSFAFLHREDGAFETLTSAFFFLSCATCHQMARTSRSFGRTRIANLLWLGSALFFIVGMEEISWCQRLLMIDTPASFTAINYQNEMNFHNVLLFHGTNEVRAFLVLSCYGVFSGVFLAIVSSKAPMTSAWRGFAQGCRFFVIPLRFSPYFLQMLVYIILRRQDSPFLSAFPEKRLIKESMECLFAIGCYLALAHRMRIEYTVRPSAVVRS